MWAASSSHPHGIVGIQSRREANAASVGERAADGGWRGAPGARSGAAARGWGIGAGTAKDMLSIRGGFGASHSLPKHTSQVIKVGHVGRGEDSGGEDDRHEGQELRGSGGR